jgi:hypothetical protein
MYLNRPKSGSVGKDTLSRAFSYKNQRNFPVPNRENNRFIQLKRGSLFVLHLYGPVNHFLYIFQ